MTPICTRAHRAEPEGAAVSSRLKMWSRIDPGTHYFFPVPVNRYAPFGTVISNRAHFPGIFAALFLTPRI
jgi:hypothetical protein